MVGSPLPVLRCSVMNDGCRVPCLALPVTVPPPPPFCSCFSGAAGKQLPHSRQLPAPGTAPGKVCHARRERYITQSILPDLKSLTPPHPASVANFSKMPIQLQSFHPILGHLCSAVSVECGRKSAPSTSFLGTAFCAGQHGGWLFFFFFFFFFLFVY